MRSHGAVLLLMTVLAACESGPPRPVATPPAAVAPDDDDAIAPLSSREDRSADPPPAVAAERPDPAEPGITELARLARYVFREMGTRGDACRLQNPFHDRLEFTLRIEVRAGRMSSVALASARRGGAAGAEALDDARQPPELRAYVSCLTPFLESLRMSPAPADGVYDAEYSFPGH